MTTNVEYAKSVNTYKVIHQQPQNDYKMSKTVTNAMKQITIKYTTSAQNHPQKYWDHKILLNVHKQPTAL